MYWFGLDIACMGKSVETYDYEVIGPDAYIAVIDYPSGPSGAYGECDKYSYCETTLTVTAEDEGKFGYKGQGEYISGLIVRVPLEGEPGQLLDELIAMDEQEDAESEAGTWTDKDLRKYLKLEKRYRFAMEKAAAAQISQCQLKVTANYADGSAETKVYAFSTVSNYDELLGDYLQKQYEGNVAEALDKEDPYPDLEKPTLYTITQVA